MTFKRKQVGVRPLFGGISEMLEAADHDLRARLAGQRVEVIRPAIAEKWLALGLTPNRGELSEYARAISAGEPFEVRLR